MSKGKSPPPPDYKGAAEAEASANLEMAKYNTIANRPDEFSPYGSRTWSVDNIPAYDEAGNEIEGPDKWTSRTELSPEEQAIFDEEQKARLGLGGLANQGIGQMQGIFDTPFSISGEAPTYQGAQGSIPEFNGPAGSMPGYGQYRKRVMDAMMSRVNRDIERDRGRTNSTLAARGIPEQADAYRRQMEDIDRKQTDARQQAEIAAEQMAGLGYSSALAGRGMQSQEALNNFNTAMQGRTMANQEGMADWTTGMDSRRQNIQEQLLQRQTPINEMSAFRTGSQVNIPQFQPYGQQVFTGGPAYSNAANQLGQYNLGSSNQDIAAQNALTGGLFDLGSAGILAYALSDRRLKKNINRIGTSLMGLPVYAFDYIWGGDRQVGVMAQDVIKVKPEAVMTIGGYMAVDYGMIS